MSYEGGDPSPDALRRARWRRTGEGRDKSCGKRTRLSLPYE
jgi:hypothetical protein